MGQLFTQVLKAAGAAKIICVDFSDYRLDYSKKSGATYIVNPKNEDLVRAVKEITKVGADVVVDCVGTLLDQCMSLVRHGGQILLVGMNEHANPQIKQYDLVRNEITIKGTYIQSYDFPKVVKILESSLLNLESLITHKISLSKINDGIDAMRKGEAVKIIIYPN
ncbi:zinc-binding dehydrogenase [Ectobacillus funiculus]|uniref:Zinc-binding dehydrogenase n=1 Tax=Ectobacillus funiculus TaxID=137993 RepID=A0ABV5WPE6_9BACI